MKKSVIFAFLTSGMLLALLCVSALAAAPSGRAATKGMIFNAEGEAVRVSSDGNDWQIEEAVLLSRTPVEAPEGADDRAVFYYHFEYLVEAKLTNGWIGNPSITFRVKLLAVEDVNNASGYRFLNCEGVSVAGHSSHWDYVAASATVDRVLFPDHNQEFEIDVTVSARLKDDSTSRHYEFTLEGSLENHI